MAITIKPKTKETLTTAVIGLGSMGLPMAGHMITHGFNVRGFDLNEEAISKAMEMGVQPSSSIGDIGRETDVVIIMVQTDKQVEQIILGEGGLLDTLQEGSVICIASSTSPFTCQELAKRTAEKGIGLVDTPVVLGQEAANNGTLTVFVGGEERWVEKAIPVLSSFGKNVIHIGDVGAGQLAKTINNMLLWTCMTANFEVLSLAKNYGVDTNRLIEALMHSSGANWSLSRWGKSTGKWAEKDMDVAMDLAQTLKTPIPLAGLVDQLVKGINQEKMRSLL
jgi:3-hydroxyisobutyrate dehydrogenase-like beta-hydroxyacid dehydrogenase